MIERIAFMGACALATIFAMWAALATTMSRHGSSHIEAMVDGTAGKPFVTRALVPAIIRITKATSPEGVDELGELAWNAPVVGDGVAMFFTHYGPSEDRDKGAAALALAIMAASLLGAGCVVRTLAGPVPAIAAVAATGMLHLGTEHVAFVYDFTTLFLTAAGMLAAVSSPLKKRGCRS